MDTTLELCESNDWRYPGHFEEFLKNCVVELRDNFLANDYLFAAVYFLVVETGFTPVDLIDAIDNHDSETFDIRKLRSITSYPSVQIEKMKKCRPTKPFVYQIKFSLGNSECKCELQGVPSAEIDTHLVINFLLTDLHIVRSICLNTDSYIQKLENDKLHKVKLKNLKDLSLLIKNKIAVYIKNLILMNEGKGCFANLPYLPEDVQKNIIYFLSGDPASLTQLGASCSYFYNIITNDADLWEIICFKEYTAQKINDTILKLSDEGCISDEDDTNNNIFRKTFLRLKNEEMRKHFRRGNPFY